MKSKRTKNKFLLGGLVFLGLTICFFGYLSPLLLNTNTWWPPKLVNKIGIKVYNPSQLPSGCNSWKESCWGNAVKNGTVKFIQTGTTDADGRKIMFAYFINTSTMFGVIGMWNYLPIHKDDGSIAASDISGGTASEIDWVYGTREGLIVHEKPTNTCYERYLSTDGSAWSNRLVTCP